MDTGTPAGQKCETQGSSSWIPATPFRPIPFAPNVQGRANNLGSEIPYSCFSSNWEATSATQMLNGEACRGVSMEPMDRGKNLPFADLLALANAASVEHSSQAPVDDDHSVTPFIFTSTSQIDAQPPILLENQRHFSTPTHWSDGNYHGDKPEYQLPIPNQHSHDLNISLGKMQNAVSHRTNFEFAPITPDKARSGKSNQVSELQNSCTDDRKNQERDEHTSEAAAERVDSNIIQYNKDPSNSVTETVAAASTQLMENHVPDKGNSHVIDLNKTPQRKPRRKKHRPKVAKERKRQKQLCPKDPTGRRKKGSNKDSTSSTAQAAGESIDQNTLEHTKKSCRQMLNFDVGQPTAEKSICRSVSDLVSEETKAFYEREVQSKSTIQLIEGIKVTVLKPETPKPADSKENPKGKRKYSQRKGLQKNSMPSPAEEVCKSTSSKEIPKGKRKYVRQKGVNKVSDSSLQKVAVKNNELRMVEPTRKSCRRALNFEIVGQHRHEESTCKSGCNLYSGSEVRDLYGTGIPSKSTVHLSEDIKLTLENTQTAVAYDLTCSVNQMLKDYMSLPEGQEPRIPFFTETNPQQQKEDSGFRKENEREGKGQGTDNIRQDHAKQTSMQIDTQSSPRIPNGPKCSTCTFLMEQGHASGSKRKYSNPIEQAEASSLNLAGTHYHTLQAYQIPWVPKIYKKRRTEKGQHCAASSTSSSATAAKDITLETTCSRANNSEDSSASKTNNLISAPQSNNSCIETIKEAGSGHKDKQKTFECLLALNPIKKLTKKRSRVLTRVRDLASLSRIALYTTQPTYPSSQGLQDCDKQQVGSSEEPHKCTEALVEETHETLAQRKRTENRNSLLNSASSCTNETQKQKNFTLYSHHQFSGNSLGTLPELGWSHKFCIDAIVDQFNCLNINQESSHIEHQEQNALIPYFMRNHEESTLVLYSRDGTIVPVQGSFDLVKKRRPRPKVELDEETNRVWKLLLENINSEGIDGTNEENAKWWEEERQVFHGRVDSFIARMHLVQGDRRFSKWKGSVVDSVVGVFLTQNVSDHLSSSAYMSLAAQFPLKSKSQKPVYGEGTSSVTEESAPYVVNPEDNVEWTEKMLHQPASDPSSISLHDYEHNGEREVVSSNESLGSSTVSLIDESKCKLLNSCVSDSETHYDSTLNGSTTESTKTEMLCWMGGRIATNDMLSQNSLFSSQNSLDSSIAQRTKSSFVRDSKAWDMTSHSKFNSSNACSFVELLQMAVSFNLNQVHKHGNGNFSSDENLKDDHNQLQTMEYENEKKKVEDLGAPKEFLEVSDISSASFNQYLPQDSAVGVQYHEMLREDSGSSGISINNNKTCVTEASVVTPKLASQTTDATKLAICIQEAPRSSIENKQTIDRMQGEENITTQHLSDRNGDCRLVGTPAQVKKNGMKHLNLFNFSGETIDATRNSIAFNNQENTQQQTSVADLNKQECSFSKELDEINHATSKPKGRRVGKDKKIDFDWDSLRRQVEANKNKKERPENNMDSLDWEAVRCSDVKKIAEAIKERGMNNMLAERIKDFLNRLVREHGNIDLEWLRDVPPDKAKEYLLSIRGLGLKSVECVRLLTLHHLAFPVDTNVGRIAVRLGWVPLQPLPESLQLHLLELYPVLESIQKYLWPRLCKLDQRTLYELHYQMITFGKVFCTKSKPNCNACPMRGECRHFASAFASSRLALPGPEDRSIVSAKETRTSDENHTVINNQLPLPLPQATEQHKGNQQSETKSEVNNCEPIIEEPATPETECIQVSETDIEDTVCEDPDTIPTIKLNMEEFTQTLQNYMQDNMELQEGDMSKALVALTAEVASIPMPKLKNVSRLRTEHQVYELPDSHPLLEGLETREPDDPGRYLLAIWTPGETANSIQPPERRCSFQEHDKLCNEKTCFSCNSARESQCRIVRGTLLIPCRTAMRGSFPLNGTYFQVNEVFADHDSSWNPINVPTDWIWNLPRRTVYFGTSVPTIFKGLTTEGIQHCFWRGYVCVRGFDRQTRAPRPLMARLHFPASKLSKTQGKADAADR